MANRIVDELKDKLDDYAINTDTSRSVLSPIRELPGENGTNRPVTGRPPMDGDTDPADPQNSGVEPTLQLNLLIRVNGDDESVRVLVNSNQQFILDSGDNQFVVTYGDNITITSGNSNKYKIDEIVKIENTRATAQNEVNEVGNEIYSNFQITSNLAFLINVTTIPEEKLNLPKIEFGNINSIRKYNVNSGVDYPILIKLLGGNLSTLSAIIGDEKFNFNVDNTNLDSSNYIMMVIPSNFFRNITQLGDRQLQITSFNKNNAEGNTIETIINLVSESSGTGLLPTITKLQYPKTIEPMDYIGLDADFEIKWETENADFIKIYTQSGGSDGKFIQEKSKGSTKLNFKELILSQQADYSEDDFQISIVLKIVPHNINNGLSGKGEIIKVSLLKSKYSIPREKAIERLVDAFSSKLDTNVFNDTTSKYLTHLLHFNSPQLVANWTGSNGSLIVKLYEPLSVAIQPNTETFITKIQSNPIIETITISGFSEQVCSPLKGPNFSLAPDNGIGYKYFEELIGSGSATSTDLVNKYLNDVGIDTTNLNIQYVNNSEIIFKNFVNYGSAKERVINFLYKIQLIESYINKVETLIIGLPITGILTTEDGFQFIDEDDNILLWESIQFGLGPAQLNELSKIINQINEIIKSFDGFENWLYTDTKYDDTLSYPKTTPYYPQIGLPLYSLLPSNSTVVQSWYEQLIDISEKYDKNNPNYLNNNLPEFLVTDIENNDFILFMDMIGQHFDIVWAYTNAINRFKVINENEEIGAPNELIWHLLKSFGWEGKRGFDSQFLWEYAFGEYKDGTPKYGISLEDANNQIWRRILNNLPYLLKHKGTSRAMKAIMACYGVPQSLLTIMEFGGPQDPTKGGTSKFTFEDRTAAIHLEQSASIIVPWKSGNYVDGWGSSYPQALEFRFKPEVVKTSRIISASQFSVDIIQTTGSFARLDLVFGEGSAEPYFAPTASGHEYITASIVYALGPTQYTSSLDFPLSTENYSSILVNKHQYSGFDGMYEVLLRTTDGQRVTTAVSMSFRTDSRFWDSGSQIIIGNDFIGEMDEVRLWTEPLSRSKFENHALFPDAINGNRLESSTEDLLLRLDFEYPKDRVLDPLIKNVSINDSYNVTFVSASNFYSASTYPYQYVPYDRTVTANVPSLGFNYSNKIRFEEQFDINGGSVENGIQLSHKSRATQKAFDKAPIDSSRLGLFFSPVKELNMDILKTFGDFNIDNYIGDPSDEYKDSYNQLDDLRKYYFKRLDRNINEYIQLVRQINKSLFDVLIDLAPARAKVSKGLLIEPHYLERSKTRWDKPTSEKNDFESFVNIGEIVNVDFEYNSYNAELDTEDNTNLIVEISNNEGTIDTNEETNLEGIPLFYTAIVDYSTSELLTADIPMYETSIDVKTPDDDNIVGEAETFNSFVIGFDPNSLANKGFGLYAESGVGIYKYYDIFGNVTSSRQSVFFVKKQLVKKIKTQTKGWPTIGSLPGEVVEFENVPTNFEEVKVSLIPFSGSISVGDNIIEVNPLNGYFSTHYKFVNNLSQGLKDSFFNGSKQTQNTTPDGLPSVEIFTTNPNILRVANTGRGSGEPILQVD
jgi:hypothetical protein